MVQPGQRRHSEVNSEKKHRTEKPKRKSPTVTSNLNVLREAFIAFCSLLLWVYLAFAFVTISFTLLDIDTYYVLLTRIMLKVNPADITQIFSLLAIGASAAFAYLLTAHIMNSIRMKSK